MLKIMRKLLLASILCLCSLNVFSQESFLTDYVNGQQPTSKVERKAYNRFNVNLDLVKSSRKLDDLNIYLNISKKDSLKERKLEFSSYEPSLKIELWKIHFAYCLTKYNFNERQESLIIEVANTINKNIYTRDVTKNSGLEELFLTRILKEFNSDYGKLVFSTLGDGNKLVVDTCSLNTIKEIKNEELAPSWGNCNCRYSMACTGQTGCVTPISGCTQVLECGIIWSDNCTGQCYQG